MRCGSQERSLLTGYDCCEFRSVVFFGYVGCAFLLRRQVLVGIVLLVRGSDTSVLQPIEHNSESLVPCILVLLCTGLCLRATLMPNV